MYTVCITYNQRQRSRFFIINSYIFHNSLSHHHHQPSLTFYASRQIHDITICHLRPVYAWHIPKPPPLFDSMQRAIFGQPSKIYGQIMDGTGDLPTFSRQSSKCSNSGSKPARMPKLKRWYPRTECVDAFTNVFMAESGEEAERRAVCKATQMDGKDAISMRGGCNSLSRSFGTPVVSLEIPMIGLRMRPWKLTCMAYAPMDQNVYLHGSRESRCTAAQRLEIIFIPHGLGDNGIILGVVSS